MRLQAIKISMALLVVAGCNGGDGSSPTSSTPSASGGMVTVEVHDFEFRPKSIIVQPGQAVRWVMRGTDPSHTTIEQNGVWNSGAVFTQDGATFERTFGAGETGRTFLYYCSSHQGCCQMQGSVRVGSSAPEPDPDY